MYPHFIVQSTDDIKPLIRRILKEGIHEDGKATDSSLSRVFRACRKDRRVSSYGDYPLMSFILRYSQEQLPEHKWSRAQLLYALKFCRFWEEEGRKRAYIPEIWNQYVKN